MKRKREEFHTNSGQNKKIFIKKSTGTTYNVDLNNVSTIYDETPIYDKTWIQKRISLIIQFNSTISTMTTIQILKYEISHRQQKPGLKQIQDQYF